MVDRDPADATAHTFLADILADAAPNSVTHALAQIIERCGLISAVGMK